MKLAQRMSRLGTESAFEVLARARALEAQGRKIIHLEIGEPDFDTPKYIRDAAAQALAEGWTHYGPSPGLPEFRKIIAEQWKAERGIPCDADNVVVTPGGKPIMFYTMMALLEDGDDVLLPNPSFPIYESLVNFLGARPVPLPLGDENGFDLDLKDLESKITSRTKLLILNSPHNPTGAVLRPETVEGIAAIARKHSFMILSDEIYGRTLYEGRHLSIASLPGMAERTVVLDGFSKTYAMTGWRLGFGIMEKALAQQVARIQTNAVSCTASFTQRAGMAALTGPQDEVKAMVAEFRRRRDAIVAGLNAIPGITCRKPAGAFYVFPNVRAFGMKSAELERMLMEQAGVACLSGTAFGSYGEGYLRFSYANSLENIQTALHNMAEVLSVKAK
ncbi:MAG: pyridoxal phosphate-dependent aminotransferase [Candidatus Eisenbacteria bacterium]|nr:pyridoxal phosphate-dependent aminotransferase [Candidatus Eisenbacteria bacterium]